MKCCCSSLLLLLNKKLCEFLNNLKLQINRHFSITLNAKERLRGLTVQGLKLAGWHSCRYCYISYMQQHRKQAVGWVWIKNFYRCLLVFLIFLSRPTVFSKVIETSLLVVDNVSLCTWYVLVVLVFQSVKVMP